MPRIVAVAFCCLNLSLALFGIPTRVHAQLTKQLQAEPLRQLALDAQEKGDPVRGALLYPQPNLGCAKCHSTDRANQLGPELTTLPSDLTDEAIVESLLYPSKKIREGYESTTVLTFDGRTLTGRVQGGQSNQIVMRLNDETQSQVVLPKTDIEALKKNDVSLMPTDLPDQLKNRQEFLDLACYLFEMRDRAQTQPVEVNPKRELAPLLEGLAEIERLQCASCHVNDLFDAKLPRYEAPVLQQLVKNLDASYVSRFIASPHAAKPHTRMPNLLRGMEQTEQQSVASQLTHYLLSVSKPQFDQANAGEDESKAGGSLQESVERGKLIYHRVGCVACHAPKTASVEDSTIDMSGVPMSPAHYSARGLTEFLEDPLAFRPAGRMPNLKLDHFEATDLTNFLLHDHVAADDSPDAFRVNPQLAKQGAALFQKHGCANCHGSAGSGAVVADAPTLAKSTLSQLETGRGCLSERAGDWPDYQLNEQQRALLAATLDELQTRQRNEARSSPVQLAPEQVADLNLASFRCTSCHERASLGGVADDRNDYFHTSNPNLGRQGRIPPSLDHVGAKLKTKWFREVLVSGRSIRPYMATRMPQFGKDNVGHLIELFQSLDELPKVDFPDLPNGDPKKEFRDAGMQLVGRDGLNCIACHTFQLKPALTMPAVDLTEMHERLQPDWFYHFLSNPGRFHRGTVMPNFWPGGRSSRQDILEGDSHRQITSIWEWLIDGRQARTPRGLIREPIELLAGTDEAVMLRRSYPGVGKRGIGVGYSGLVNLVFDAEQMRVAMLWQGKFADPSGVWRSQGHGSVRPLARQQTKFHPGPDVDNALSPWQVDEGRPPQHQFLGYTLDAARRPKFLYRVGDVQVEDYSVDTPGSSDKLPMLRRTITFKALDKNNALSIFLRPTEEIQQQDEHSFLLGGMMTLTIASEHHASIHTISVENADGKETRTELQVPLALPAGELHEVVLEYRWLK